MILQAVDEHLGAADPKPAIARLTMASVFLSTFLQLWEVINEAGKSMSSKGSRSST
jgi:hypothetical protein